MGLHCFALLRASIQLSRSSTLTDSFSHVRVHHSVALTALPYPLRVLLCTIPCVCSSALSPACAPLHNPLRVLLCTIPCMCFSALSPACAAFGRCSEAKAREKLSFQDLTGHGLLGGGGAGTQGGGAASGPHGDSGAGSGPSGSGAGQATYGGGAALGQSAGEPEEGKHKKSKKEKKEKKEKKVRVGMHVAFLRWELCGVNVVPIFSATRKLWKLLGLWW